MKVRLHWAAALLFALSLTGCGGVKDGAIGAMRDAADSVVEETKSELRDQSRKGVQGAANQAKSAVSGEAEEEEPAVEE